MNDFTYETNTDIDAIARSLREAGRVLITSHEAGRGCRPGLRGLARYLRELDIEVEVWIQGPVTPNLAGLVEDLEVRHAPDQPSGDADLVVVVDAGAPWSQPARGLPPRPTGPRHRDRPPSARRRRRRPTPGGSDRRLLHAGAGPPDRRALGVPLEAGADRRGWHSIAEALLLGLATDTGWFGFESLGAEGRALLELRRGRGGREPPWSGWWRIPIAPSGS